MFTTCVQILDNKISNDGKLEMVEFDSQQWLTHEVSEEATYSPSSLFKNLTKREL